MNILLVFEKKSVSKFVEDYLFDNEVNNDFKFGYTNHISHLNCEYEKIRKKDDKYYLSNSQAMFKPLELDGVDIPVDTYLEYNNHQQALQDFYDYSQFDMIISLCDKDIFGALAFAKYLQNNKIPANKAYITKNDVYSEEGIVSIMNLVNLIPFNDYFSGVKELLVKNNFECEYPRKSDILSLRRSTGINRREFADYFNIPYRTVENWENDVNTCPAYLYELMVFKLKTDGTLLE